MSTPPLDAPFHMTQLIRMYDTDAAGILYFGQQFRFTNDAFESMLALSGFSLGEMIHDLPYGLVVVHAESNYRKQVTIGDLITVYAGVTRIGNTSITLSYFLFHDSACSGTATSTHVTIDKSLHTKIKLPAAIRDFSTQFFWEAPPIL